LTPFSTAEPKKEETKITRPLNPPPYSPEILNNLSKYSVWSLSVIGRELVQELIWRTQMLMNLLLKLTDRRYQQQAAGDPEQLLEYCQMILTRIIEIRLRIDRVPRPQQISEDDFIAMMADPSAPVKSPEQVKKEEMFEAQRQKLVRLSSALKSFEWMCSVSDPRLLKKPEKF
uniref:Mediator complex subunit 30 n=1 Tax=Toxocara canis TaxID=6265 RepID=A0A183UZ66_TOXCA